MTKKKGNKKGKNWFWYPIIILVVIATGTLSVYYYQQYICKTKVCKTYEKTSIDHLLPYEVHGIDVSKHNGELDWNYISKHTINDWEIKFIFIRATVAKADGSIEEDKFFRENWKNARENNLIRGAYHFYSPIAPVNKQISIFSKLVNLRSGDLPPVLDIENYEKSNIFIQKKHLADIKIWLNKIEKKYGVTPIIYTSRKLYEDFFYKKEDFKKYKYWLANYSSQNNQINNLNWLFWQHSENGKINGHSGDFDLNVFNGTEKELENNCIQ